MSSFTGLPLARPGEPASATFRIWSPDEKSDVYAGVRDILGKIKISLHASGKCYAGLVREFADRNNNAVALIGGSRHQSMWTRSMHTGNQIVVPLQFVIPESELCYRPPVDIDTVWIDPPDVSHSIIISCIFSGQSLQDANWPGRANGTNFVGSKHLPNEEKLWLIWQNCPTSELERNILREAADHMVNTDMVQLNRNNECVEASKRILIFKEFHDSQCLVVLDSAGQDL